jgi:hypothetical protein
MKDLRKATIVVKLYEDLRDKSNIEHVSEELLKSLLSAQGLGLDDPDVQVELEGISRRGFIELKREKEVYFRLLLRGVEIPMSGVLKILRNEKAESRNSIFRKAQLVSYTHAMKLELDDDKVQAVLQKWHNEGKIELIKGDDVYLKLLI